jgi:hypothetical protein
MQPEKVAWHHGLFSHSLAITDQGVRCGVSATGESRRIRW